MSRILQAMKMASEGKDSIADRLQAMSGTEVHSAPRGKQVQEFRDLANSLIHLADQESGGAVVVFASTNSGEGASYVSFNCARYLALMINSEVAWIDGNFLHPHKKLKNSSLLLSDLLRTPEDAECLSTGRGGMTIIGSGDNPAQSLKLLDGPNYQLLLKRFQRDFAFTIVDAPPILDSVEPGHLAKNTMGLVLVVESRRLKYEIVQHGLERVANQNVNLLGTVLNKRRFQLPEFLYKRT